MTQTNKACEWITLLLALASLLLGFASLAFAVSGSTGWHYTLFPLGAVSLVLMVLFLQKVGFFSWVKKRKACWFANRVAKHQYRSFLKHVQKAENKLHALTLVLESHIQWHTECHNFASTSFHNQYNEISQCARQLKVHRVTDLELIGSRFRDFLDVINSYYYQPFAKALREGKGKYRYDDTPHNLQRAKDAYDRYLDQYNEFCEELNAKAGRQVLIGIHTGPSMMELPTVKFD